MPCTQVRASEAPWSSAWRKESFLEAAVSSNPVLVGGWMVCPASPPFPSCHTSSVCQAGFFEEPQRGWCSEGTPCVEASI
jgi:hypothetical protein